MEDLRSICDTWNTPPPKGNHCAAHDRWDYITQIFMNALGQSNWKVDEDYMEHVFLPGPVRAGTLLRNIECIEVETREYAPSEGEEDSEKMEQKEEKKGKKKDKKDKKEGREKEQKHKRAGLAPQPPASDSKRGRHDGDAPSAETVASSSKPEDLQAAQDGLLAEMRRMAEPLPDDDPVKPWAEQVMKQLKKDVFFLKGYVSGEVKGAMLEAKGIKDIQDPAEPAPSFLLHAILGARWMDVIQRLRCDPRKIAFERVYPWTERGADDWRFRDKTAVEILVLDMVVVQDKAVHKEIMENLCCVVSDLGLWDREFGSEGQTLIELAAGSGNKDFLVQAVTYHRDNITNANHSFVDAKGIRRNAFDLAWGKTELLDALEAAQFPRNLVARGQDRRAQYTAHYRELRDSGKKGKGKGSDKGKEADKGKGDKGSKGKGKPTPPWRE